MGGRDKGFFLKNIPSFPTTNPIGSMNGNYIYLHLPSKINKKCRLITWIRNGIFLEKKHPGSFPTAHSLSRLCLGLRELGPETMTFSDLTCCGLRRRFAKKDGKSQPQKTGDFSWGYRIQPWKMNLEHKKLEVWFR